MGFIPCNLQIALKMNNIQPFITNRIDELLTRVSLFKPNIIFFEIKTEFFKKMLKELLKCEVLFFGIKTIFLEYDKMDDENYLNEIIKSIDLSEGKPINFPSYKNFLINMLLQDCGISYKLCGYNYLRDAIKYNYYLNKLNTMTASEIFNKIAVIYSTTQKNVERAIRNAIKLSWNQNGDSKYFDKNKKPPTTANFVQKCCAYLDELEIKE